MALLALSRPLWRRQLRDPAGLVLAFAPLAAAGGWLWAGGAAQGVLLAAWAIAGLVPTALAARRDERVESRWRSLPVSAGERWLGTFLALLPFPLLAALALAAMAHLTTPTLALPTALAAACFTTGALVALGVAVGAWSRTAWQLAGLLATVLLLAAWALRPDATGWLAEALPTGQARLLLAHGAGLVPCLELAMQGLVFAVAGVAGIGRR